MKKNYLGESLEDYTEAIFELEKENGVARVTDIAQRLSVSKPSVTEAFSILKEKGIIVYAPYRPIRLTQKGKRIAKQIKKKHDVLADFLIKILKVDPKKAKVHACRMEHILEKEVTDKFSILAKTLIQSQFYKNLEKEFKVTEKTMVELTKLKKEENAVIAELKGGKEFHSKMASLGLTKGLTMKVLQNYQRGPIIILVGNTRIALGRGKASKILVKTNE